MLAPINFLEDVWIPNLDSIRIFIQGPFTKVEAKLKVVDVYENNQWKLKTLSFALPDNVKEIILDQIIEIAGRYEDKMIWSPKMMVISQWLLPTMSSKGCPK